MEVLSAEAFEVRSRRRAPSGCLLSPFVGRQATELDVEVRCSEEMGEVQAVDFGKACGFRNGNSHLRFAFGCEDGSISTLPLVHEK